LCRNMEGERCSIDGSREGVSLVRDITAIWGHTLHKPKESNRGIWVCRKETCDW
jgi:hypothetical protein